MAGQFVQVAEVLCIRPHTLSLGRIKVPIQDVLDATISAADMFPYRFDVTFDGWKIERFVLLRPLAYFVAYGKKEIFDCLEIAVRSLFEHGHWQGDVWIITDEKNLGFVDRLPTEFVPRVQIRTIPAHDILDFTLARYKITEIEMATQYQPLIYFDVDIVIDSDLNDMVQGICFNADLHFFPEHPIGINEEFHGNSQLKKDGIGFLPQDIGASSGVFAFRNVLEQRSLFKAIVETAYKYRMFEGAGSIKACYDQPFFNYVLYKLKAGSGVLLKDIVKVHSNARDFLDFPVRRGMVHFAGGVGNSRPKLDHMRSYFDLLGSDVPATVSQK
jgi:hypothetical protein